jgi:Tol biopolymer transport system component
MTTNNPVERFYRLNIVSRLKAYKGTALVPVLFACIAWGLPLFSYAQGSTNGETFGQNRVQYKDFTFQYYESDNFTTYFYQGGQDIGKYVIKSAEDNADEISRFLDFKYRRKIDVIVYNNINELNQTNVGIYEQGQNPGGTTKIPDSKMYVYFNGDHAHLDKQIREGIARIYMDKMMAGSSFAEVIQNAVLLNLPDWYKEGMISYLSNGWNADMEDKLRDGILSGRYKSLSKLTPEEQIFVGHSIWHYIEEVYGKSAVGNVLYLTRVNRSVDNGFLFVLGTNLSQTLEGWYKYYVTRYTNEESVTQMPDKSFLVKKPYRKGHMYYELKLSPDGKNLAYATNDMGRYKVHILDTQTGKKKVVFKGGFRTNTIFTDKSIPLLAWEPTGRKLAIINDKRSVIYLNQYELETKKTEKARIAKFQKVVSFSYAGDSKNLVMSAIKNGQTDIYLYTIASTTTRQLTNDYFDDLQPAFVNADSLRGILFVSNRYDDTLREQRYESQNFNKQLDVFFYNLDANTNIAYRITNTPLANESYPQPYSEKKYSYLSEANGTRNRYLGEFQEVFDHNERVYRFIRNETNELDSVSLPESITIDSVMDMTGIKLQDNYLVRINRIGGVTAQRSNYTYNIREQSIVPAKELAADLVIKNNRAEFYKYPFANSPGGSTQSNQYMQKLEKLANEEKLKAEEQQAKNNLFNTNPSRTSTQYDSLNRAKTVKPYDFQSEFDFGIKLFDWDSVATAAKLEAAKNGYIFRFSKVRPYFVRFAVDKVVAQLDNNLLVTRYQPFNPANPEFNNQPVSFFIKLGITDLLENHKLYGGIRLPFVGIDNTSEYFITYENLTKRLDKKFTFYRSSRQQAVQGFLPYTQTPVPDSLLNEGLQYSTKTNYAEVELKYPFDVLSSVRFSVAFRNDKVVFKSVENFSLNQPVRVDNWLFLRAEYVYDNCLEVMTNIRYGTRFKFFAEIHKQFPTTNKELFGRADIPVPKFNNIYMGTVGFDLRHYQKIHKQIIWATRVSGALSYGTAKLIYYLGGMDNWYAAGEKFDRSTPINYNNGYAFQTLATPLRGFKQNARNGSNYLLINSELRFPIFAYLIKTPVKSEIIRNLQLVGFIDIGTAWEGLSPFSDNNPLFSETIPNNSNSVILRIKRYRTPVVMGFGPGIRTTFLGYFMKFDVAWGYDTGEVSKKPSYYFTLGLDF